MKLLLSLLFLIVISVTVKSQVINFIGTYSGVSNNKCNSPISGVGYSIREGVCVSNIANFQNEVGWGPNKYNFILSSESNKVVIKQFETFSEAGCDQIIGHSESNLNQCGETPNFQGINVTSLTSVTSSSSPQYQSGTLVIAQYSSNKCNNESFLYATTYTNGYSYQQTNETQTTYSCKNGVPFAKNCNSNGCQIDNIATNCALDIQRVVFCQK